MLQSAQAVQLVRTVTQLALQHALAALVELTVPALVRARVQIVRQVTIAMAVEPLLAIFAPASRAAWQVLPSVVN